MPQPLKYSAVSFLRSLGVYRAVLASRWRRDRLLIIGYHGLALADEDECLPHLYIRPETFRRRMESLQALRCNVLPFREGVRLLQEGRLPERAVAITVDDGLMDFYLEAFPVLKEFGYPATVYQTTYYSGKNRPVFDVVVIYILWKGSGRQVDGMPFTGKSGVMDLATNESRWNTQRQIKQYAADRNLSGEQKDALAVDLARALQVDYDEILRRKIMQLMTPEQIKEIVNAGIDVQLHTHRHRTPRSEELFTGEIRDNRERLSQYTARPLEHFCYPSGVYYPEFLPWLKSLGVFTATTCEAGIADQGSEPLLLPRFMDNETLPLEVFEAWVVGISSLFRELKRKLGLKVAGTPPPD